VFRSGVTEFNVPVDIQLGHFRDESFQAVDCTGNASTMKLTTTKNKYTKT